MVIINILTLFVKNYVYNSLIKIACRLILLILSKNKHD